MKRDFKIYYFNDMPDGRCIVTTFQRDIEDIVKEFGECAYDNTEDVLFFKTRPEANDFVTQKAIKLLNKNEK